MPLLEAHREYMPITGWAEADRPREKLLSQGRRALTDAELVAILIGSGTKKQSAVELAKKILGLADNSIDRLGKLSVEELMELNGVGEAKAISIVAALELGRRRKEGVVIEKKAIGCSGDAYEELKHLFADLAHEECWCLYLNRANKVEKTGQIGAGGFSGTAVDLKVLFREALLQKASGLIISHNHPSGSLNPSKEDKELTKRIKEGCSLMGIALLDHLICTDKGYFSFADEGIL